MRSRQTGQVGNSIRGCDEGAAGFKAALSVGAFEARREEAEASGPEAFAEALEAEAVC